MPVKDTSIYVQSRMDAYDSLSYTPPEGSAYKIRGLSRKLVRTRTGSSMPNWKQRIKDQQSATTYMTATYDSVELKKAACSFAYQYFNGTKRIPRYTWCKGDVYFGAFSGPIGGAWTGDAEVAARTRFYKQVKSAQQSFDGGVFLGELKETMRMIKNPAEGFRRQIGNFADWVSGTAKARGISIEEQNRNKRGPKKAQYNRKLRQFVNDVAGSWLENAFGLQPFLNDIEDARQALNDLLERDRTVQVQAGGRAAKLINSSTYQTGPDITGTQIYALNTLLDKETYIVRYRGAVYARAQTTYGGVAERFGLTLSNFIPTAWELLPWSFLMDYFANIGDCLEAAFTDTSNIAWMSATTILSRKTAYYWQPDVDRMKTVIGGKQYVDYLVADPGYTIFQRRVVTRNPGISGLQPFGLFTLKFPPFDSAAGKWLNISALLAQVIQVHPQDIRRNYTKWGYNPTRGDLHF